MSNTYPDLNLTTFPENVDNFVQMMDIAVDDASALKSYQEAMETGNIIKASEALKNMSNASQKILTADKINKIHDAIQALERFYGTDIVPYITQIQANWQNEIGKFAYKGDYQSTTMYLKNNIVSYRMGVYTFLYICVANAPINTPPPNALYWRQLTIMGTRGESGENMSFMYDWNNTNIYEPMDCVIHNNKLWGCVVGNTNSEPSSDNSNWEELMSIKTATYPIQPEEPIGQTVGELWFKEILA